MNKNDEILDELLIIKMVVGFTFLLLLVLSIYVSIRLGGPLFP